MTSLVANPFLRGITMKQWCNSCQIHLDRSITKIIWVHYYPTHFWRLSTTRSNQFLHHKFSLMPSWMGDQRPDPIAMRGEQRVFTTQLVLCVSTGLVAFLLFCSARRRWPRMYAARLMRQLVDIKPLPDGLFRWIKAVILISDSEILRTSGLDAYVYLAFFRMGARIFLVLTLIALFVLSPIRYYFTGKYDKDDILTASANTALSLLAKDPSFSDPFPAYDWVYPIFTYLFSGIVYYYLYVFTNLVLRTRQKYLASQNSIVDRTFRLDGIPKRLLAKNDPRVLKRFIESLGVGAVADVKLLYDWSPLEKLFHQRALLLLRIEHLYVLLNGMHIEISSRTNVPLAYCIEPPANLSAKQTTIEKEITGKLLQLRFLDSKIKQIQSVYDRKTSTIDCTLNPQFKPMKSAFITMESVASAQMASQTVLDPRVYRLIASLAPAPCDIRWNNFRYTYFQKQCKSYLITVIILLSYLFIIFLVTPLTTLLDLKTLQKLWPALGNYVAKSKWATTFVTGILPPLLFSALNLLMPYFYQYLSEHQGYASNSDEELSTLSKNFFFVFFNLFLVFIATGTLWDYISYISDTTQIAYQLARSLKKLSLFYVDLILLQGLAMFPVRLLQISNFVTLNFAGRIWGLRLLFLKTPRDYRKFYYTPEIFSFGIDLPQHLLIFMIVLIYSVVSTKIVTSGLVYFALGAFVYKYQLVYNAVHPPHSTGKVWPMMFRRVVLGLVIFQLFMCGTLALESAVFLAALCAPLVLVSGAFLYNFEKYYLKLNQFIALRAIINYDDFDKEFDDEMGDDDTVHSESADGLAPENVSVSTRRSLTLDEGRELFSDYTNPHLIDPLYGPWIAFEGNKISMIKSTTSDIDVESGDTCVTSLIDRQVVIRKTLRVSEWE